MSSKFPTVLVADAVKWLGLPSQNALARLLGVTHPTVSRWKGTVPSHYVATLMMLHPSMFGIVIKPMSATEMAKVKPLGYEEPKA